VSAPLRQSLEWPSGDVSEVVPYRGFTEKPGVPVGDTVAERQSSVAAFDGAGRQVSVPVPGRIVPAPPPERLERRETPIPPGRMPPLPGGYNGRLAPGESARGAVVNPGLQPGERPGDPKIPNGA
jgi:hypothetical protein